jgi:hypothetical protein
MNPIPTENQRPGTRSWINTNASVDGNRRSTDIEGFCSKPSYRAGDLLQISVSSSAPFIVEFYRLGFYGGNGARLMRQQPMIPGTKHGDPPTGDRQLRECNWPVSVQFNIPFDWPSGVYLGKLTQVNVSSPTGSYVIFVVRDDRQCDFLFKCSETTWSAYNGWPDNYSLYDFHGEPPKVGYWGPGVRVSFDRPYAMMQPWYMQHEPERCNWMIGASTFLIFEYPLLFWMESQGFDVSYLSCLDLRESSPVNLRQRARALLATGHDEYYSVSMHDNLRNAVEATDDISQNGLSVAFFCAGSMTGVLELAASTFDGGRQNRIIRRKGRWGPIEPWLLALQPEQADFTDGDFADGGELMGARLVDPAVGVANWRCVNTGGSLASRLYNDTGLHDGDEIRGLVGHEFTGNAIGRPGLEVVAEDHLTGSDGQITASRYTATIFPGPKGNFVFNASTMWWPQFLNGGTPLPFPAGGEPLFTGPSGVVSPDPTEMHRVQLMTKNLFGMFLS